jgi:GNAT superfamily N-acetyltransferase
MFDVALSEKLHHEFSIDLPENFLASLPLPLGEGRGEGASSAFCFLPSALPTLNPEPRTLNPSAWSLGLITGPSGSGKTTLARRLFGPHFIEHIAWPEDRALIDCFADSRTTIQELTRLLTAVGLSSPPTWIKPYHVLSTGEQFRANLARHVAASLRDARPPDLNPEPGHPLNPLLAADEFTSTLNRPLARIASAALAKAIRAGHLPVRFVAVTCHEDIARWLAPDWIIDMASRQFRWVRLRTPAIKLQIARGHHSAWQRFAPHHYLSGNLNKSARCFLARWQNVSVAFCATLPAIGRKNHRRISRLVTLPDYQGVGIGTRLLAAVARAVVPFRPGRRFPRAVKVKMSKYPVKRAA